MSLQNSAQPKSVSNLEAGTQDHKCSVGLGYFLFYFRAKKNKQKKNIPTKMSDIAFTYMTQKKNTQNPDCYDQGK